MSEIHDDPEVATGVAEQTVPVGGSLPDGTLPGAVVPTLPAGIVTTRELASLEASPMAIPYATGQTSVLVGRSTSRRRIHITTDIEVWIGTSPNQVSGRVGFRLPPGVIWSPTIAAAMWVYAPAAATVTYWAELDAG